MIEIVEGQMANQQALSEIKKRIQKYSEIVDLIAGSLNAPIIYDSGKEHFGYRYGNPDGRHFCVLQSVRMVSCLNACIALADGGFHQEIFILIRTFVEADAHVRFVLGDLKHQELSPEQNKFVVEFFADYQRNEASEFKRPRIPQKKIHDIVGEILDSYSQATDPRRGEPIKATKLFSNVYLTSSNYVHGRYPEIMDKYGGSPARFHMDGMKDTPKDLESIEAISTFCDSIPLLLRSIVMKFDLQKLFANRADLISALYY